MKSIEIDGNDIMDWNAFHSYFKDKLGFPDFYGSNMDAWIDCMSYLDEPGAGMTEKSPLTKGETLALRLTNVDSLIERSSEIFDALVDCSAFVNFRRAEAGKPPLIALSYFNMRER